MAFRRLEQGQPEQPILLAEPYRQLLEATPSAALAFDRQGNIIATNSRVEKMFGYTQAELLGQGFEFLLPVRLRKFNRLERLNNKSLFGLRKNGDEIPIEFNLFEPIKINEEQVLLIITINDATEKKKAKEELELTRQANESQKRLRDLVFKRTQKSERISVELFRAKEQLFQEKERMHVTFESIADGVITTDIEGRIEYLNPVAERFIQKTTEEIRGSPTHETFRVVDEETLEIIEHPIQVALTESRGIRRGNAKLINDTGKDIVIEYSVAPINNRKNQTIGAVMVFHDTTKSRQLMAQIAYQASHDALTGLMNRNEFESRLKIAIENAKAEQSEHAFLYMDLDQFKVVNDTCGHVAGDELLRQIASLLHKKLRNTDNLARLGGDEFGLLLEYCSHERASKIAEEILQIVTDFRFTWENNSFRIGASIGLVPITEHSGNMGRVLSLADSSCYAAKDAGRNRIYNYSENETEMEKRYGEMEWVTRIMDGIEEDRFCFAYQEIKPLDLQCADKSCYEILLRLRDQEGNIVTPGAFLPAAERYNLSLALDRWVVQNIFAWLSTHPKELETLNFCTVNLSGNSLTPDFMEYILGQLEKKHIPTEKICFEITETSAIANLTSAAYFIEKIKEKGCHFALDDFGAGMSSFGYLKNLQVDYLKIDGMFVRNIVDDPISFAMVKSINEIGHIMNMKTIAEFVESEAIRAKLEEIGVDFVQGHAIAMPKLLS